MTYRQRVRRNIQLCGNYLCLGFDLNLSILPAYVKNSLSQKSIEDLCYLILRYCFFYLRRVTVKYMFCNCSFFLLFFIIFNIFGESWRPIFFIIIKEKKIRSASRLMIVFFIFLQQLQCYIIVLSWASCVPTIIVI